MPIPYRKAPRPDEEGLAAYLDVFEARQGFVGAMLLVDSRGRPLEFVHNQVAAPSGFLWPATQVRRLAVASLAHSLFDACRKDPDLLVCRASLGEPEFCRSELGPSIPFACVQPAREDSPVQWSWLNDPPTSGMKAHSLAQALQQRGLATEPFDRLTEGLREVYPGALP